MAAFILAFVSSLAFIRLDIMVGRIPGFSSRLRKWTPTGDTFVPLSSLVVKQMFLLMMSEGYIDLKSNTQTQ